jgi:hypothetical protein
MEQHPVGNTQKEVSFEIPAGEVRLCQALVDHDRQVKTKKSVVKKSSKKESWS